MKSLLVGIVLLMFVVVPLSHAQEDTVVYTTADGRFTLQHLANWEFSEYAPEQIVEVPGYDTLYAFFVIGMDGTVAAEAAVIDPGLINPPGLGARISDSIRDVTDFISYSVRHDELQEVKPDWSDIIFQELGEHTVAWVHSIHEDCPQCRPTYFYAYELGAGLYFIAENFSISNEQIETFEMEFFGILESMQMTTTAPLEIPFPAPIAGDESDSWQIEVEDIRTIASDAKDNIYLTTYLDDGETGFVVLDSGGQVVRAFSHPTLPTITDMIFGQDGTLWLIWEADLVKLDPQDGTRLADIFLYEFGFQQIDIDENGTFFVARGDQQSATVKSYSAEGEELSVFHTNGYRAEFGQATSLAVLPDSTILLVSPGNGLVFGFDSEGNPVEHPVLTQLQADFPGNPEGYFEGVQMLQYLRGNVYVIPYEGEEIEAGVYRYNLDGERTGFLPVPIKTLDHYQSFTFLSDGSIVYLSRNGINRSAFPEE